MFGRVSPEDKLRLARLMQEQGLIVAMTGDAVNDAAALKQADIGVAMGSGSEVSKQAARMILTDDNFGTLVHAVELGRTIYAKVVSYIRYQMTQLLALVLLFLAATVFDINSGVAHDAADGAVPELLHRHLPGDRDHARRRRSRTSCTRPPRDPNVPITNRAGDHPLGAVRRGAVPRRAGAAACGARHAAHRPAERVDDDVLRRASGWARSSAGS